MLAPQNSRFLFKSYKNLFKCSWLISNKHASAPELKGKTEMKTSYKNPLEKKTPRSELQAADCRNPSHPSSEEKQSGCKYKNESMFQIYLFCPLVSAFSH